VTPGSPCAGLQVVELAVGVSALGLGLAGALPGRLLSDLGAAVTRIEGAAEAPIDRDVPWSRPWHRDKKLIRTDDAARAFELLKDADVVLAYGPEDRVEGRGLGYADLRVANPAQIYARCRPSVTGSGQVDDYALLVEARAGFLTQLPGNRPGPTFVDVRASGIGAASLLTVEVLALLGRRARTGAGGWAETSLYDGLLATLGCMIGRSERAAPEIESYWEHGSTFPNFLYRCADGELLQVWFGGKGMYQALIEVLGDEPSADGYYTDQMTGRLGERARRWVEFFAARPRADWIACLRAAGVACEPVLAPGEILADPHLAETGLAIRRADAGHDDLLVGSPITVGPLTHPKSNSFISNGPSRLSIRHRAPAPGSPGLLAGLRVVDFSAFVAGPLAAEILADLGADVIKVEPPGGEAMRAAAYAVAACQRGKRSLALDITAGPARPVLDRLLAEADVVLHNFRVGVAERLGIDAAAVARLNPDAVHCHASAFGPAGRRARFPGNDALMQAVTGFERAIGGDGGDPVAATWIPIDMTGGWLAAVGILAGLYARAAGRQGERGSGQSVATSLLGAGVLLHSGVFRRDGELVRGPSLDADQTGYGPGYRIYQAADDAWFALVIPAPDAWRRLSGLLDGQPLPATYAPLRGGPGDAVAREAEATLAAAFRRAPAAAWVARLRALGLPAELIEPLDRDGFRRAILDDPVNRQLGRVAAYPTADWGHFEQIGPLVRCGPDAAATPRLTLPGVGEHTTEILAGLGLNQAEIDALLDAKIARQLAG
jgi:crotonobetainyl-CoA:carnitine CoA-transferase CaiB-like acyl-CoA transferase